MPGALDGVRVLDLSWGIAGPLGRAAPRRAGRRRDQGRAARRRPVPRLQRLRGVEPVPALGDHRPEAAGGRRGVPQARRRRRRDRRDLPAGRHRPPRHRVRRAPRDQPAARLLLVPGLPRGPPPRATARATTRSCRRAAASNGSSRVGGRARSSCTCRCRAWARCSSCPTGHPHRADRTREHRVAGQHVRTSLFQGALLYTTQIWHGCPKPTARVLRHDGARRTRRACTRR